MEAEISAAVVSACRVELRTAPCRNHVGLPEVGTCTTISSWRCRNVCLYRASRCDVVHYTIFY